MDRRRFLLAGLTGASAVAGCLGRLSGTPSTFTSETTSAESAGTTTEAHSTSDTRTNTETSTEGGGGANRVVKVTDAGTFETGTVTGSLELRMSKITSAHTAELLLSLRNRSSDSVTLSYTQSRGLNLITGTRSSGDARLLLVGEDVEWTRTDGCWQPDARTLERGVPDRTVSITLDAGETQRETYRLWDHPENRSCLPRGTYQFARSFGRNGAESTWRFALSLS